MTICTKSLSIISATGCSLSEIYAKVKIGKHLASEFKVNKGMRQGDAIAPVLFNVVLETAI